MSDQTASQVHARGFAALPSQVFAYGKAQGAYPVLPAPAAPPAEAGRMEVPLDELSFFHLRSASEIAEIQHLRSAIALPASALSDPEFRTREKKETSSVSSAPSNAMANSSGPSGSYRSPSGSRPAMRSLDNSPRWARSSTRRPGKSAGSCSLRNTAPAPKH